MIYNPFSKLRFRRSWATTPTLSITSFASESEGQNLVLTITRSGATSVATPFQYTIDAGTTNPASSDDLTDGFGLFSDTFAVGERVKSINIPIIVDSNAETDEAVKATITSATGAIIGEPATMEAYITETPFVINSTVTLSSITSVAEGSPSATGNIVVTFSRTGDLSTTSTVTFTVEGGSAISTDLTNGFGTFTVDFDIDDTTKTYNIPIDPDSVIEPDETVQVTITDATNSNIGTPSTGLGTIFDDDSLPTINLTSFSSVVEGTGTGFGGNLIATFTRTGNLAFVSPFTYSLAGGTATDNDLAAGFGTFGAQFNAMESTKVINIGVSPDGLFEEDETVQLTLLSATNAVVGGSTTALATIVNDDLKPTVSIRSVSNGSEGTAVGGALSVTFMRTGNTVGSTLITYRIGPGPTNPASANDISGGFQDYQIGWAPGQTTDITVILSVMPDSTFENDETIRVTIVDAGTNGLIGVNNTAVITILNDDFSGPTVPPQTVEFGALTLANAGGIMLKNNSNVLVPVTQVLSVVSTPPGKDGTGWDSLNNRLVRTTGTPLSSDGVVLRVRTQANDVDVTIATIPDTYSFCTPAEMAAIVALNKATAREGKIAKARPGTYNVADATATVNSIFTDRSYSTGFTWSSHGDQTDTIFIMKEKWGDALISGDTPSVNVPWLNVTNETWEKMTFIFKNDFYEGNTRTSLGTSSNIAMIPATGTSGNITFQDMTIKTNYDETPVQQAASFYRLLSTENKSTGFISFKRCLIEGVSGISDSSQAVFTLEDCEIRKFNGFMHNFNKTDTVNLVNNFYHTQTIDNSMVSVNGKMLARFTPLTNATDVTKATIHFNGRISTGTGTTEQVIFGIGSADFTLGRTGVTNEKVALYIKGPTAATNPNSIEFVAYNTSEQLVLSMNSGTLPYFTETNILVSVDTNGSSYMHIWLYGGRTDRTPTQITIGPIAATIPNSTVNFSAQNTYVGSRWSGALNALPTGSNRLVSIRRLALWTGIAANITSSTVRNNFYDGATQTQIGRRLTTTSQNYMAGLGAIYVMDVNATKESWVNGNSPNIALGGPLTQVTTFTTFSGFATWNTAYSTGSSGVAISQVNFLGTSYGTLQDATAYNIKNNVFYGGTLGSSYPNGLYQGIVLSDIKARNSYKDAVIRNNIFVINNFDALYMRNSRNSKIMHNTFVTFEELLTSYGTNGNGFNPTVAPNNVLPSMNFDLDIPNGTIYNVDGFTGTLPGTVLSTLMVLVSDPTKRAVIEYVFSAGAGSYNIHISSSTYSFADNDAVAEGQFISNVYSVKPAGWTANINGPATFERAGATNYSGSVVGNVIAGSIIRESVTSSTPNLLNNNITYGTNVTNMTTLAAESLATLDSRDITNWRTGVGTVFTSRAVIENNLKTKSTLRTQYEVKTGWDAYVNTESPYDAVTDTFTVPAKTNQPISGVILSDLITPTFPSVPVNGAAAYAMTEDYSGNVEIQLLDATGTTVLRDWGTNAVVVTPGQKIRIRRTASSNIAGNITTNTWVIIGDKRVNFAITTKAPIVIMDERFTSDVSSNWIGSTWNATGDTTPGAIDTGELRMSGTGDNPSMRSTVGSSNLTIGKTYRIIVDTRRYGTQATQGDLKIGNVSNGSQVYGAGVGWTRTASGSSTEGRYSTVTAFRSFALPDFVVPNDATSAASTSLFFWLQHRGSVSGGALGIAFTRIQILQLD